MSQLGRIQLKSDDKPFYMVPIMLPVVTNSGITGLRLSKVESMDIQGVRARTINGFYTDNGNPRTKYPYTVTVTLEISDIQEFKRHSEEQILNRDVL